MISALIGSRELLNFNVWGYFNFIDATTEFSLFWIIAHALCFLFSAKPSSTVVIIEIETKYLLKFTLESKIVNSGVMVLV